MKKWLLFVIPFSAILISALTWYWIQPTAQINTRILTMPSHCQLHTGDCVIEQDGISVRLTISPQPIPIAKALNVTADIQGVDAIKVQLDINGSNMYMGYNRVSLTQTATNEWQGKSILSFCTIDEMQWQLTLLIDLADGHQIQAPFSLITPFKPSKD
jgi:hypothetical protein